MSDIYDIARVISQIAADGKDHAYGGKETGALEREKGHMVNDSRVIDGFSVRVGGDALTICYELECKMKDTHSNGFETDLETTIEGLASYLKKEYKSAANSTLTLKADGEMDVFMQEVSRVRVLVRASKNYTIGGVESAADPRKEKLDKFNSLDTMLENKWTPEVAWKRFLEQED